jgi:type VI secretion system protein ImpI
MPPADVAPPRPVIPPGYATSNATAVMAPGSRPAERSAPAMPPPAYKAAASGESAAAPGNRGLPSTPSEPAGPDFRALLRGAGLDVETVDPAIVAELGQVLRIVVGGLMEVLRARGEIKGEFRLQQTTFKPRENNPLKFSANVEDALHNLLVKRNAAYLNTPAAFEDAFVDVRHHQVAMLAGMRAAFEYMLTRFNPEALAAQFDARPGRSKLSIGLGAGSRHWDSFADYYKEMTRDADDCFRRLFGDHFARAYEEQLQRLRAERSSLR